MKRRSNTKISCYKPESIYDINGHAAIVTDGETFCIEIESEDKSYQTIIDMCDILTTLSELI